MSTSLRVLNVGVLALQGAFEEHIDMLKKISVTNSDGQPLSVHAFAIRLPEQLENAHALVIPGGESTTIGKIAVRWGLIDPLKKWVTDGKPVWGTCAGMILLSAAAKHGEEGQPLIGAIHMQVSRNFFGAQIHSFEMKIDGPPGFQKEPYNAIFIRAPAIISVEDSIEVLSQLRNAKPADGSDPTDVVVAARKENILVTAFHPELTSDSRWHQYYIKEIVLPILCKSNDFKSK